MPTLPRSVAAVGDVENVNAWSGIPFHFLQAARKAGFATEGWRLDLTRFDWPRRWWTLRRLLRGRRPGGFQYGDAFLDRACAQVPPALLATEIITFNQHYPPARAVAAAGGELNHYIDATFAAMTDRRALDLRLPPDIAARGRERERANYAASRRVVTMARWAARSAVEECGVDPAKVFTILPGANLELPSDAPCPMRPRPAAPAGKGSSCSASSAWTGGARACPWSWTCATNWRAGVGKRSSSRRATRRQN